MLPPLQPHQGTQCLKISPLESWVSSCCQTQGEQEPGNWVGTAGVCLGVGVGGLGRDSSRISFLCILWAWPSEGWVGALPCREEQSPLSSLKFWGGMGELFMCSPHPRLLLCCPLLLRSTSRKVKPGEPAPQEWPFSGYRIKARCTLVSNYPFICPTWSILTQTP